MIKSSRCSDEARGSTLNEVGNWETDSGPDLLGSII
jgi:hypothetical protein